jgi:hypothetical protein
MGQSPGGLPLDMIFWPIRMLGAQMTQKHASRAGVHRAGDGETLGTGFGSDDLGHLIVHYLNMSH